MSALLAYLPDDGYTERAALDAVTHVHPRVEFTYRPMLVEEAGDYYRAAQLAQGAALRRLMASYLARHLKSWDVKGVDGNVLALDHKTLLRLKPRLFNRLFLVVSGDDAPDARPGQSAEDAEAEADDARKAAEHGRTVAEVREERLRKNS